MSQPNLLNGDILLHDSGSQQGKAIKGATGSDYTHCGIYFREPDGNQYVVEAVQPVKKTPLADWVKRGVNHEFTVRRMKDYRDGLPEDKATAIATWLKGSAGKNYDKKFLWDDQKIYCSELVYKAYEAAGLEVCPTMKVRDLNLEHPAVKALIEARFESPQHVPLDETIVPPSSLAKSEALYQVYP